MTPSEITPGVKRSFRIKVFGVGGAGCNAVNHIARAPFEGVEFIALNTDLQSLQSSRRVWAVPDVKESSVCRSPPGSIRSHASGARAADFEPA